MKLKVFASILAMIIPLGHSTKLRKTVLKNIDKTKSTLKTKVVIPGAVGEPSANDLDILGQILIESYNYIKTCPHGCCHCASDSEGRLAQLTGFHVADIQAWTCPYGCCLCPNDDEKQSVVGFFDAVADSPAAKKLHGFAVLLELGCSTNDCSDIDKKALENSICTRLKSSSAPFWTGAYNCALDLAVSDDDHIQSELASKVVIPGVVGEPSATDFDILGKAMLESYNYIRACPYGCCTCGNDSEELTRLTGFNVGPYDIQTWTCPYGCCLCPNDDEEEQVRLGGENSVERNEMTVSMVMGCHGSDCSGVDKAELENAVCARLKSSGSSYWSGANNCSILDFANQDKTAVAVAST